MNKKKMVLLIIISIIMVISLVLISFLVKRANQKSLELSYKNKIKQMEEDLNLYISKKSNLQDNYDDKKLDATSNELIYDNKVVDGESIVDIIPDTEPKELAEYEVKSGQLQYNGNDEKKKEWFDNATKEPTDKNNTEANNTENTVVLNKTTNEEITEKVIENVTQSTDKDEIELKDSIKGNLKDYKIYGNTIQDRIPEPENPAELKSLGNDGKINIMINNNVVTIDLSNHDPLRKIGDTCDFIDYESGTIVRNIGKVNFTGAKGENWYTKVTPNAGLYTAATFVHNAINNNNFPLLSNRFVYDNKAGKSVSIFIYGLNGGIHLTVPTSIANSPTEIKSWIANHNVEVYYKLANPVSEEINLPEIPTSNESTKIQIEGNIPSSGMAVKYEKYK